MTLEELVRQAVAEGSWNQLGDRIDDGFTLRSSSQHGRVELSGRQAVDHLERPGPGELLSWDCDTFPTGLALTFEWRRIGAQEHDRRRWYLRTDDGGRLVGLWSYSARPQADRSAQTDVPASVLSALGVHGSATDMEHGGNSGAALRQVRVGEELLVLKRSAPGADWLGRVTGDDGRTGQLWQQGVFAEIADLLDTGIVEAVRDDGAWWVAMRDVSPWLLDSTPLLPARRHAPCSWRLPGCIAASVAGRLTAARRSRPAWACRGERWSKRSVTAPTSCPSSSTWPGRPSPPPARPTWPRPCSRRRPTRDRSPERCATPRR